jgi:hypothetical protein
MKIRSETLLIGLAASLALALGGCSAGVSVGSATFESGPDAQTTCTRSYGGHWQVPDSPDNGLRERRQCVITSEQDDDGY